VRSQGRDAEISDLAQPQHRRGTISDRSNELINRNRGALRIREGSRYSKDLVSKDFRRIRAIVFGPNGHRQLLDFRRSGKAEDREAHHSLLGMACRVRGQWKWPDAVRQRSDAMCTGLSQSNLSSVIGRSRMRFPVAL
jgi:hypothetical protein